MIDVRMTEEVEGASPVPRVDRMAATTKKTAAAAQPRYMSVRLRDAFLDTETPTLLVACAPASAIHFNSRVKSAAFCHRSSGSFARHDLTMRSRAGGVIGRRDDIGGGAVSSIFAIRLAWLLPSKAFFPVAISYSTAPNAKMSVRASASLASSCSGAMYCNVPRMLLSPVIESCNAG